MTPGPLYAALEDHADGDLCFDGWPLHETLEALVEHLVAGEDGGRTVHAFELRFPAPDQATCAPCTQRVKDMLVAHYRALDDTDDGLTADERCWVHPLAEQAGFEWTLNEWEIEEIGADYALQQAKEG